VPTVISVAATNAENPRYSAEFSYLGRHDRSIHVGILCPTWDTENPATTVKVQVQQSFDNGDTWEDIAILEAHAGQRSRNGFIPNMTCQVTDTLGARLGRGKLTVSAPITVGVDATVV
jgi:hypothetical protein